MTVQAGMEDLLNRLKAGDQASFEQLANALVSRDNDERKQAETFYQQLMEHHPDVGVKFLGAGLSSSASNMKRFCCLYLRKVCYLEFEPVHISHLLLDLLLLY
jgi:hypothetical protein